MADDRKILIVLSAEDDSDDEEKKQQSEEKEAKKAEKAKKQLVKKVLSSAVNEFIGQATYQYERYISLTEDYKTQIMVDNVKTTISKVKSIGSQVYSGIKLGLATGSAGVGAAAAVLGLGIAVAHESLGLIRQYNTQNLNLEMNDRQAFFAQSRLGLIDNGRGTQN